MARCPSSGFKVSIASFTTDTLSSHAPKLTISSLRRTAVFHDHAKDDKLSLGIEPLQKFVCMLKLWKISRVCFFEERLVGMAINRAGGMRQRRWEL